MLIIYTQKKGDDRLCIEQNIKELILFNYIIRESSSIKKLCTETIRENVT